MRVSKAGQEVAVVVWGRNNGKGAGDAHGRTTETTQGFFSNGDSLEVDPTDTVSQPEPTSTWVVKLRVQCRGGDLKIRRRLANKRILVYKVAVTGEIQEEGAPVRIGRIWRC